MTTAKLLDRRTRLMRELATVNAQIDEHRRAWSYANGYRVPVRFEQFQREMRNAG